MKIVIFKRNLKNHILSSLILASLLVPFSDPSLAHETSSLCMSICWIPVPPIQGKCSEGEILPSSCQKPSEKISECSCLRPIDLPVPCLPTPIISLSNVVTPLY